MGQAKPDSRDFEIAVAEHFGIRQNVIVPNISWGLRGLNHECDLLLLRDSGFAEEIEIKVSASDIRRDLTKGGGRGHARSPLIRKLWFAVPLALAESDSIPEYAGVLALVWDTRKRGYVCVAVRAPAVNSAARKLSDAEKLQVLRLSNLRVWSLKQKLRKLERKELKNVETENNR